MRLRLFERLRRLAGRRSPGQGQGQDHGHGQGQGHGRSPDPRFREEGGRHRKTPGAAPFSGQRNNGQPRGGQRAAVPPPDGRPHTPAGLGSRPAGGGIGRARIREVPFGAAPADPVAIAPEAHRQAQESGRPQPWYQVVSGPAFAQQHAQHAQHIQHTQQAGSANAAALGRPPQMPPPRPPQMPAPPPPAAGMPRVTRRAALPFASPHPKDHPPAADGRRNCGALEKILWRQWDAAAESPPPEAVAVVDRLAEFPRALQEKLAAGLEAIYVGKGGVPDLDDMASLHGRPLPGGMATWDDCAGAYGDRKIVVGTRPSPTPDVICHEVGHALDDLDSPPGSRWQSDSAEFRVIYDQCHLYIASDFHRQPGGLGRKELFADAFAAIASAQRPALVDMLNGNTRIALRVMLYFNRRYGI